MLFLLMNCGSTKKIKAEEKGQEESSLHASQTTEVQTQSEGESRVSLTSMITGFEIEPENGVPAVFSFVYNGQKIEGSTTGKMKFSNENKNENKIETHKDKTQSKDKTQIKYETKIRYKTRYKDVERSFSWWIWLGIIILIIVLWEFVKRLAKKHLKFIKL